MSHRVWAVLDTKGNGRVVGVFDTEEQAAEVMAVSPQYYRLTSLLVNEINPETLKWVQDDTGRQKLTRLSQQVNAIPDDNTTTEAPASIHKRVGAHVTRIASVVFGAGIVWQLVVIVASSRSAVALEKLSAQAGVSLPAVSGLFLDTHAWWWVVPTICAIQFALALRRRRSPKTAAVCAIAFGLFFQVWADIALLEPVRALISKLG